MTRANAEPIAIVGMGAIFPGRGDVTGFWRDLFEGRDLITDVPASHWLVDDYYDADPRARDRTYGRRGGFINPVAFDPMAFGIPPKAMQGTDTAQLLALVAAQMTLDDISRDSDGKIDKTRTSIILGVASATELTAHMAGRLQRPTWVNAMRQAGLTEDVVQDVTGKIEAHYVEWQEATFPGLLGNVIAGRIANRFDLGGSNYVTDAACASSLSALQIAMHELRSGDSDTVLTGGVDALNDILMYMCFSKTPALSPTGDCRPFSNTADGTILGEGVGMLALRRLSDAERDGNTIHALIRAIGGASDGKGTAIYSPLPSGQARALKRAYDQAGYDPSTVDLVEAHGTGTRAGDKAEIEGLHMIFGGKGSGEPWCALGSVKSQMGHAKAAAGAASLIKAASALSRKVLPPTIKVEEPADAIAQSDAFYLNTEPRPWISAPGRPRRASVSSFGFGGSNFHVALEEYTGKTAVQPWRSLPSELFLVSAKDAKALADVLSSLTVGVEEANLAIRASASHVAFDPKAPARAAIVADTPEDLSAKAQSLVQQLVAGEIGKRPLKGGCHVSLEKPEPGPLAFMFSGQGSQYIGMGSDLAMAFPAARQAWDDAAGHPRTAGLKLHKLAFPPAAFDQLEFGGRTEALTAMQHAQPAIAVVALSHLALLERAGLKASMSAGHSFGEIMALHYGGAMNAKAALTASAARGALMAQAAQSTSGGMFAVQASASSVSGVLSKFAPDLVLANDNGPSQVVLSGPVDVVERAMEACGATGLKARKLPVATAFHSSIVAGAVTPFAVELSKLKLKKPSIPVYANTSAAKYDIPGKAIAEEVAAQLAKPVRFREMIEGMYEAGARVFVEVGPGSIVSGLVNDVLADKPHTALSLDNKRANGVSQFLSTLGALSVLGFDIDFARLFADMPAEPEKPAPSKHAVPISGANVGKPYPPGNGAAGRAAPVMPAAARKPATTRPESIRNPTVSQTSPSQSATLPDIPMTDTPSSKFQVPAPVQTQQVTGESPAERILMEVSRRHADFLSMTSAAHSAFLNTIGHVLSGTPLPTHPMQMLSHEPARSASPATPVLYTNGHDRSEVAPNAPVPRPKAATVPVAAATAGIPQATPAAPAPGAPAMNGRTAPVDAIGLVRKIIAEKTGYPEDMLDGDMDLEGELGVDSIKQVEILSTLRETLPALPEIDPERLVELRTINAIAAMVDDARALTSAAPARVSIPPVSAPAHANGAGGITSDIVRVLIADKTGYPVEMLEDDMDLEGELGVDSIKQVEILSALREQYPSLPEVDPEVLTELRTIRAIADFFA